MRKIIKIDIAKLSDAGSRQVYVYRIASFNIDKVLLEKHCVSIRNTFDGTELVAELSKDTEVGTITQRVSSLLIPEIMQSVDMVITSFDTDEKVITDIHSVGITPVVQ